MNSKIIKIITLLFSGFVPFHSHSSVEQKLDKIDSSFAEVLRLENRAAYVDITPDLGGRLLSYALQGKSSVIKLGEAFYQRQRPEISPSANNVGYLGHIVWIGPQSEWWSRQNVNLQRKQSKASWPPDPYLIFGKNRILRRSENSISLSGLKSPLGGMRINKSFSLDKSSSRLALTAELVDRSDEIKNWDIWFNTRVHGGAVVYIPLKNPKENLRISDSNNKNKAGPEYRYHDDILSIQASPSFTGKKRREGKLFIQAKEGWMAAFSDDQLFVIEFTLAKKSDILADHAQVEIYANFPNDANKGLIEMELHGPAGKALVKQYWSLYEYKGENSRPSHIAFLKSILGSK